MYLENLVVDAVEPRRLGRFWEAVVGGEQLTDEPAGYETRLAVADGPVLDLCFPHVADAVPVEPQRLVVGLLGGTETIERLIGLGASRLDVPADDAGARTLADPEGHLFRLVGEQTTYAETGPIAALSLDSADPARDVDFWSWLTGWTVLPGATSLRHPSRRGPVLELRAESRPKSDTKNRLHLDIRLESDDDPDEVAAGIAERGGRELHFGWGDLPWRHFADPSGNELCVLPAPSRG